MTVADRVRLRRESLGLSQAELAKKMNLKSRSSITRIEKSGNDITLRDVERLAEALNCSIPFLMGWDEPTKTIDREQQEFYNLIDQLNKKEQRLVYDMILAYLKKE